MSASPTPASSGPSSSTLGTSGTFEPVKKKRPVKMSIFNSRKPVRKVPAANRPTLSRGPGQTTAIPASTQPLKQATGGPAAEEDEGAYEEYPIFISKTTLDAGLRYHALKLQTRIDQNGQPIEVNPYNESHFTRPLRLHRRHARDKVESSEPLEGDGIDDKERELLNVRRAERQAEREENQKLIAPTAGDSSKPTYKKKNQKRAEEPKDYSDPARQKQRQLKYEETRPWHLEDFEGKNVWVGSYEDVLSESSIMLEISDDGGFRMVPIEKWYKFIPTNKVNSMTSEEIEKYMQKKVRVGRWGMGTQKANDEARRAEMMRRVAERRARAREEDDMPMMADTGDFNADRDMLDMDYRDEFQDDDEGVLIQGEEGEDDKEIEQKIWMEMFNAGLGGTGVKEEDLDPEAEEHQRQLAEKEEKRKVKRLRKQLKKRERRGEYATDSDESESDSDEDTAEGDENNEDTNKVAEANGDKSGTSSRGTNTPNGRPEKRPIPDQSDLSGNESSRKRVKGANGSALPTKTQAVNSSLSLNPPKNKARAPRSTGGSGSGSDTDTSRAGRPKAAFGTPTASFRSNTPGGSRAASPSGSRAQSPKPNGSRSEFPTLEEVKAAIPPTGIQIKDLVALFKAKVGPRSSDFISLVRKAGVQDKKQITLILPKA